MADHKKPTQEELDEKIAESVKELEEVPEEKVEEKPEEVVEETPKAEVEEPVESVDYKKKFVDSSREAQVLHSKSKKMSESFEKAIQAEPATEEELRAEYAEWDMMSDFEKKMAKDTLTNNKRFKALDEITREFKDIELWQNKVQEFIEDPATLTKNPLLEGKVEEFKLFATKPTRKGVDFEDLVSAFLFTAENFKPKNKGKMFESGTNRSAQKSAIEPGKISLSESVALRKNDYQKYKEMLKAGRIDMSDL